ncbi:hypothetical protein BH10BAC2_BH10BAC2_10240 [soil metagenome]
MNAPILPKKHHFVPECYLKNFIVNRYLYSLDIRKVEKGYNAHPKKCQAGMICYYEDYYKIQSQLVDTQFKLNEYADLFIETEVLHKLEQEYTRLFRNITTYNKLSFKDAVSLSDFIIQLKLRNPYWLENTIESHKDEWIDTAIDNIYEETFMKLERFNHIPEEIQKKVYDYIRAHSKSDSNYSKKIQLSGLIRRYSENDDRNNIFREAIIKSKWILLISPLNGPYFVTSDNPGFSTTHVDDRIYNTRFSNDYIFHFPLSPRFCLMITDISIENDTYDKKMNKNILRLNVDSDIIIEINNRSLQCINKLIIASEKSYLEKIAALNKP